MDEREIMSVPKEYEYTILNLRVKYLEKYRQTTTLSDFQLWEICEYIEKDDQLQTIWNIGTYDGE